MTSRSGRGRWQRVLDARRQARQSLGRLDQRDVYDRPIPKRPAAVQELHKPSIGAPLNPEERTGYVLTLAEAATRLGLSRGELEAMIDAGKVEALATGLTRTISISEVERVSEPRRTHE